MSRISRILFLILTSVLAACLCACGKEPAVTVPETVADASSSVAETEEGTHLQPEEGWSVVTIHGVEMLWDGTRVKDQTADLEIDAMSFSDFGEDLFTEIFPVTTESRVLCPGEITETEVLHVRGQEEGPVVYIVAGVHGDEIAAWYAGRLLRGVTLKKGELYVIAPANANGAMNRTRYVTEKQDLNRSFPGSENGNEAERIADAIYRDIEQVKPYLVLDLHEAIVYTSERDFLGSSLIFTELGPAKDLFFDLLFATQDGELCANDYVSYGPGPQGSINNTVSNRLGIPVITVETFRGFEIGRRVSDQLQIVQYVLQYLGMR